MRNKRMNLNDSSESTNIMVIILLKMLWGNEGAWWAILMVNKLLLYGINAWTKNPADVLKYNILGIKNLSFLK